jgi:hypothetical protein
MTENELIDLMDLADQLFEFELPDRVISLLFETMGEIMPFPINFAMDLTLRMEAVRFFRFFPEKKIY